jgi:hypothetical protein
MHKDLSIDYCVWRILSLMIIFFGITLSLFMLLNLIHRLFFFFFCDGADISLSSAFYIIQCVFGRSRVWADPCAGKAKTKMSILRDETLFSSALRTPRGLSTITSMLFSNTALVVSIDIKCLFCYVCSDDAAQSGVEFSRCGGCVVAQYCSRACQSVHSSEHKRQCIVMR